MSELLVNTIKKADGTGSLSVPAESGTVVTTASPSLGRRNLIINGAMQVAQRGTQSTGITTTGFYTCDRFRSSLDSLGTWTEDQSTDAPSGFSNSFKLTCTTADASPSANDVLYIRYALEGQNLQHLSFGNSDAKELTLSFWVKSNKTGNATVAVVQPDNSNREITPSYTINSADTWEYKTISIPADTSGLLANDNGMGLAIQFWLNSGSTYTGGSNVTSWGAFNAADLNASNLGVGGATSDYFAITGVQLEVGSVATPFEHRSYGEELALCQRYYEKLDGRLMDSQGYENGSGYTRYVHNVFAVVKRAAPTITEATVDIQGNLGAYSKSSIPEGVRYAGSSTASGNVYRSYTNTSDHIFDAEL